MGGNVFQDPPGGPRPSTMCDIWKNKGELMLKLQEMTIFCEGKKVFWIGDILL